MLSATHDRAYQDFLTLLTEFGELSVGRKNKEDLARLMRGFNDLKTHLEANIVLLDSQNKEPAIASRWQSVHTEIVREYKLLSTDMLFLASARQQTTQVKRIKSINNRLTKLIGYCQIMLKDKN